MALVGTLVVVCVTVPLVIQHQAQVSLEDDNQTLGELVDRQNAFLAQRNLCYTPVAKNIAHPVDDAQFREH